MYALLLSDGVYVSTSKINLVSRRLVINATRIGSFKRISPSSVLEVYGCHKPQDSRVTRVYRRTFASLGPQSVASLGSSTELRLKTDAGTMYVVNGFGIAAILHSARLARTEYIQCFARTAARLVTLFAKQELDPARFVKFEHIHNSILDEVADAIRGRRLKDVAGMIAAGLGEIAKTGMVEGELPDRFREYIDALFKGTLCTVRHALVTLDCVISDYTLRMIGRSVAAGHAKIVEDKGRSVALEVDLPNGMYLVRAAQKTKRKIEIDVVHDLFRVCKMLYVSHYTMSDNTLHNLANRVSKLLEEVTGKLSIRVLG